MSVSETLFVCPPGNQVLDTDSSGNQYAACTAGAGSLQNVTIETPFDPSMLNDTELGQAFTAGFITMATGLVIIGAAKMVLKAFR